MLKILFSSERFKKNIPSIKIIVISFIIGGFIFLIVPFSIKGLIKWLFVSLLLSIGIKKEYMSPMTVLVSFIICSLIFLFVGLSLTSVIFWLLVSILLSIGIKKDYVNKQSVAISVIMVLVMIFCGDVYLRLTEDKKLNIYPDYQNLLKLTGAPSPNMIKNNFMGTGTVYHEYYLWGMAPHKSSTLNITNSDTRECPDSYSLNNCDAVVWLFGGSTILELCTTDSLSIANQIVLNLKKSNIKVHLINFGQSAFNSSLERIKFEEMLKVSNDKEIPNYVVFYDGYNDGYTIYTSGPGKFQGHLSKKIEAMVMLDNKKLLSYSFSNILSDYSYFWKKYFHPLIENKFYTGGTLLEEDIQKAAKYYCNNTQMIEGICNAYNIKPIFILQPMIFTKQRLSDFEKQIIAKIPPGQIKAHKIFYNDVKTIMSSKQNFYDLTGIFDFRMYPDFWDVGHTGPYSGQITGKEISTLLIKAMKKDTIH